MSSSISNFHGHRPKQMEAQELVVQLHERGVQLSAHEGRLKYAPATQMSPQLLEQLRIHKHEIVAMLQASTEMKNSSAQAVYVYGNTIPPEEYGNTVDSNPDFGPPAAAIEASRGPFPDEEVLPKWPAPPCAICEFLELWEDAVGNWRCLHCEPPTAARRFRQLAERIRKRGKR